MKRAVLSSMAVAAACGISLFLPGGVRAAESASTPTVKSTVVAHGSYLEARSLSVYAGACHYNGELTTAGREAVLAWNFTEGQQDGVKLNGIRAFALVAGNDNLSFPQNARRSVLYIDAAATPAQRDAVVHLLQQRVGATLGTVAAIKTAPVSFTEDGDKVTLKAEGITTVEATRYPCSHCRMPADTWYDPLTPTQSQVAEGVSTGFSDKTLGVSWSQTSADNVYVGTFQM